MIELELPYPPSVNHYWRAWRGRMIVSRQGRAYRQCVCNALAGRRIETLVGRLAVQIELFPPDRRRRDSDNALKAVCDSVQHAGVFRDDSQIVWLLVQKAEVVSGGKAIVRIAEIPCPTMIIQKFPPWSLN